MFQQLSKLTIGLVTVTSLSGCLLTQNRAFNQQALDGAQLINEVNALPFVSQSDMPDTGSATYTGVASLNYDERLDVGDENNDYNAEVTLEANFGSSDLTGEMTNFQSPNGAVDGTLDLENGAVIDNFVDGDFVGTIEDDGESIDLSVDIDGVFRGDGTGEPAAISGDLDGDYTTANDSGNIFGSYVATID